MRLWVVTSPDDFSSEFDDIEAMFSRGLSRLILSKRVPSGEGSATDHQYERWLMALPMDCRDRIWVRGTPGLAERLEVRGCVCDAKILMGDVPESWKRVNCIAFCNSPEEVAALPEWVAGALLGPVFQPQSVMEPVEALGMDSLACALAEVNNTAAIRGLQVIAFGGIDHENLDDVKKLPLQGISVLGGIWNYADPLNAFIKLSRACGGF